ncbi:MAG: methylmalonyl Co-A mutase-associated GTPase MeaB [Promethearchaeota archaeon]
MDLANLISRFNQGDEAVLGRMVSLVENYPQVAREVFKRVDARRRAHVVGVTGAPGAGKSSLVNLLVRRFRDEGRTVGVVCVDPSSPYTGGAFLGDRVRMQGVACDPGVFVRSLGSRGSVGGLSKATFDVVRLLEAFGKDLVVVETVGAGQVEVEVVKLADTVLVVLVPGMGDAIQVQKAGIMEIGDVLVVNKSDLGGDAVAVKLEEMLDQRDLLLAGASKMDQWRPPVVKTVALTGEGVDELVDRIREHREYLARTGFGDEKRMAMVRDRVLELVIEEVKARFARSASGGGGLDEILRQAMDTGDLHGAAEGALEALFNSSPTPSAGRE